MLVVPSCSHLGRVVWAERVPEARAFQARVGEKVAPTDESAFGSEARLQAWMPSGG
ncbi:MAG: hypothetical protein R3A47_07035 [Polyangiales bacterium]